MELDYFFSSLSQWCRWSVKFPCTFSLLTRFILLCYFGVSGTNICVSGGDFLLVQQAHGRATAKPHVLLWLFFFQYSTHMPIIDVPEDRKTNWRWCFPPTAPAPQHWPATHPKTFQGQPSKQKTWNHPINCSLKQVLNSHFQRGKAKAITTCSSLVSKLMLIYTHWDFCSIYCMPVWLKLAYYFCSSTKCFKNCFK